MDKYGMTKTTQLCHVSKFCINSSDLLNNNLKLLLEEFHEQAFYPKNTWRVIAKMTPGFADEFIPNPNIDNIVIITNKYTQYVGNCRLTLVVSESECLLTLDGTGELIRHPV